MFCHDTVRLPMIPCFVIILSLYHDGTSPFGEMSPLLNTPDISRCCGICCNVISIHIRNDVTDDWAGKDSTTDVER